MRNNRPVLGEPIHSALVFRRMSGTSMKWSKWQWVTSTKLQQGTSRAIRARSGDTLPNRVRCKGMRVKYGSSRRIWSSIFNSIPATPSHFKVVVCFNFPLPYCLMMMNGSEISYLKDSNHQAANNKYLQLAYRHIPLFYTFTGGGNRQ